MEAIVIIIYICLSAAAATDMQNIAVAKGAKKNYWGWCFFLPIIGHLMVCALPDLKLREALMKTDAKSDASVSDDELPSL